MKNSSEIVKNILIAEVQASRKYKLTGDDRYSSYDIAAMMIGHQDNRKLLINYEV